MSDYAVLASYYDALMEEDYEARADYLLALFARFGRAPASLLDLCCGSGVLTALLAERGVDMIGADVSEDMLALAVARDSRVLWLCQDMRALDLRDTVEGAVCTLDSLNHLLCTADIAATLSRLRLFIAPGGLLIFDVNTPYKHREVLGDRDYVLEQEGLLCAWRNRYYPRTGEVCMTLDFFAETGDGRYARETDTVRERAYTLPTWKRLLTDAGFALTAAYADLTDRPASDSDERWTLVARNLRPPEEYQ